MHLGRVIERNTQVHTYHFVVELLQNTHMMLLMLYDLSRHNYCINNFMQKKIFDLACAQIHYSLFINWVSPTEYNCVLMILILS